MTDVKPDPESVERVSYTIEVRERGKRLSYEPMPDPFHTTRIWPRGWRVALAVLLRRYELEVIVSGDRETCERVMELNSDYLGPPGSPSREAWNRQLDGALRDFAAQLGEHDVS